MKKNVTATTATLLYADTRRSADMLYLGKVEVHDPFIALKLGRRKFAVLNRLEFARVRKEGIFDEVLSLEECKERAKAAYKGGVGDTADIIRLLARELGIDEFIIGSEFPAGLAFTLRERKLKLQVAEGMLFPQRLAKTDEEADAIREGNAASAAGFKVIEQILRRSKIVKGKLHYNGKYLTSELVREEIEIACLRRGAAAMDTIVAGGDQACDPHCRGYGVLRANELIIVDIFPRIVKTGYHGDMTRTYLKGKASDAQRHLVETVFAAQQKVIPQHRSGANGLKLYQFVQDYFTQSGYETKTENGISVGFFHGLGHGLGLDIHEPPRVSAVKATLRKNEVVTVEPGLYYPGLGGCRIEDVVRIGAAGPELLSSHPYRWEIS